MCGSAITHWAVLNKAVLVENDLGSLRRLVKAPIEQTKRAMLEVGKRAKTITYSTMVDVQTAKASEGLASA